MAIMLGVFATLSTLCGSVAYLVAQHDDLVTLKAMAAALFGNDGRQPPRTGRAGPPPQSPDGPPPTGWTRIDLTAGPASTAPAGRQLPSFMESPGLYGVVARPVPARQLSAQSTDRTARTVAHPATEIVVTLADSIQDGLDLLRDQLQELETRQAAVDELETVQKAARERADAARRDAMALLETLNAADATAAQMRSETRRAGESLARSRLLVQQRSQAALNAVQAAFNAGRNPKTDPVVRAAGARADQAAQAIKDPTRFIKALERDAAKASAQADKARDRLRAAERKAADLAAVARREAAATSAVLNALRGARVDIERTQEQLLSRMWRARHALERAPQYDGSAEVYMLRQAIRALERRWR